MKLSTSIVYLLCVMAIASLPASCSKAFLTETDPTKNASTDAYKDSAGIGTGVIAAYSSLQNVYGKSGTYRGIFPFADVTTDDSYSVTDGSGIADFEYFSIISSNPVLQGFWSATYKTVASCNIIIDRIGAVPMNETVKSRYIGEMKFIRALAYFNAVRIWGEIPLVTKEVQSIEEGYIYGKAPVADVYRQIIADFTDAEAALPVTYTNAADLGRATKPAAKGMLAKVYVTLKDYSNAVTTLSDFVRDYDNTVCSLQTSYANVFLTTNEMNSEILFAVRYKRGGFGTGSPFYNFFGPSSTSVITVGTAGQFNLIRKDLNDSLTANGSADTRRAAAIGTVGTATYYTKKYLDPTPTANNDAENDWIVLRYADVLLMYAEALNEAAATNVATALPYINKVRARAGIGLLTAATQTQFSLRKAIVKERRFELHLEGHRWFDLVRTGDAITVLNNHFTKYQVKNNGVLVTIDEHNLLFPIPQNEINTNPVLVQNDGY